LVAGVCQCQGLDERSERYIDTHECVALPVRRIRGMHVCSEKLSLAWIDKVFLDNLVNPGITAELLID
jgi:hypothetical protein